MLDFIAHWHREHVNFAKLLYLLEEQLDFFRAANHPDYERMTDIVYYMTSYPDRFHHPREDVAFQIVAAKDSRAREYVTDLIQQHQVIAESGQQLLTRLAGVVGGAVMLRDDVERPGRIYIDHMRQHMSQEEDKIFPLAAKLLGDEDWAAVEAAIPAQEDPLFGPAVEERYKALHRQIAADADCGCVT